MAWFEDNQPMPATELHYDSAFHLLIAVILSAQCTDKRVNMVVPPLFERYPEPSDLASATLDQHVICSPVSNMNIRINQASLL